MTSYPPVYPVIAVIHRLSFFPFPLQQPVAMDSSTFRLSADDYAPFIPTALDGFELRPSKAHLIGRKTGDGYKFTYTLEWYQEVGTAPSSRQSRSRTRSNNSEKRKMASISGSTRREKPGGGAEKKAIIGEEEGPIPRILQVVKIDNKLYQIVDNEKCQLEMEGNCEFNQMMRDEAIRQGLYYPTTYTPNRNGKVTEYDDKRKSKSIITIRKKYYNEWMRLRNQGARYNGPWKGLLRPKDSNQTELTASVSHPRVDFLNEPDWLEKYPALWPMCRIVPEGAPAPNLPSSSDADADWTRLYYESAEEEKRWELRKERDAARKQWLDARKKELDGLDCLKMQRGSLSDSSNANLLDGDFVQLMILLPDNKQAVLMHRATPDDEVKPFVIGMLEGATLPKLPPISETIGRLYYKTAKGRRRRLRLDGGRRLNDVEKADTTFWRFYADCRK